VRVRFEAQIIDPGCPANLVVKFRGRLSDDLHAENPGRRGYNNVVLKTRPGIVARELTEGHIQPARRFSIRHAEADSLIRGQVLSPDIRSKVIAAGLDNG